MRRLFAPMLRMVWATAAFEPCPISTIAMTAETPMTIPSVVRAERMTLRPRALRARRSTLISAVMTKTPNSAGHEGQLLIGRRDDGFTVLDAAGDEAVLDADD